MAKPIDPKVAAALLVAKAGGDVLGNRAEAHHRAKLVEQALARTNAEVREATRREGSALESWLTPAGTQRRAQVERVEIYSPSRVKAEIQRSGSRVFDRILGWFY